LATHTTSRYRPDRVAGMAADEELRFLEWVLGSGQCPCEGTPQREVLLGQARSLAGPVRSSLSVLEYHHAVDRRNVRVVQTFVAQGSRVILADVSGRHVGAVGEVLPTGRWFSTFVHAISRQCDTHLDFTVHSALSAALVSDGIEKLASPDGSLGARGTQGLLSGDVEATRWSRAWGLPRRLARLGLLLIAGEQLAAIGLALGISLKSVRTYTEQLFRLTGVTSRGQLPLAALMAAGMGQSKPLPASDNTHGALAKATAGFPAGP
jgi:hypothetical protein